jgi:uncharacterized protein involved in type VI secretion and phage assembly
MSTVNGVVVGIVKSLEDPENLGRIQVHFPWLSEQNNTFWARTATLMTGRERGSWFMPELEDEVLVAFERCDTQHPYIIGYLWNGQDKPPNDEIDTKVRRLRTVSGHQLDFDDRSNSEKITLSSKGNHRMEMDDTGEPVVTITTGGGHKIIMQDGVAGHVTIETNGGQKISLNDTPPSITLTTKSQQTISVDDSSQTIQIQSQAGLVDINCLQASVRANSMLSIQAPITQLTGVLQINGTAQINGAAQINGVMQALSVVSPVYTPGAGNLFGL